MSFNVHPRATPIPPLNRFWQSRPTHKQIIALVTSIECYGPGRNLARIAGLIKTFTRN